MPLTRGRSKVCSHQHASHRCSKKRMATLVPEVTQPVMGIQYTMVSEVANSVKGAYVDMLSISGVVLEQVDNSISLDAPQTVATIVAQLTSSIGSIPPGLNKLLEPVCAASTSTPLVETNCDMGSLKIYDNEVTSTEAHSMSLEEGEFTPVITKKNKKLFKKFEKVKMKMKRGNKVTSTSHAFLMKGAKLKHF